MSIANSIKTVLIVGATSGLGEQFARRLHALGKKIIITGRRTERLSSIKSDLKSNVETYEWDITDLSKTTSRASEIVAAHPDIDSIFLVAGFANFFNYLNPSSSTDEKIIAECTTNVTAQALLTRIFLPHLASVATKGQPASYVFVGSGMGFAPNALFPLYASTKAQTHHFAVALRQGITKNQSLNGNLSIVEIVAPYVATDFDKGFRSPHGPQPMPLDEFMGDAMAQLEKPGPDGKPPKEIAVGTAQPRVDLWRNSVGKFLKDSGMDD